MENYRTAIVFLVVVFSSSQLCAGYSYSVKVNDFSNSIINGTCIKYIDSSSYLAIENSLLNRTRNLVRLREAFFPTNQQASISVNIIYHFVNSNETVTYRWLQSSVLMLIRSDLLHYLSLFMYNVKTRHTHLLLDPICDFSSDDSIPPNITPGLGNYCKHNNSIGHHLLNNLTAKLLSYATHWSSVVDNEIDLAEDSGYSVYVFNVDNPSDFCVFDEVLNFSRMRALLIAAFAILEFSSILSIPLLLASVYEDFKEKMEKGNIRYFVWASLILIVLIILLLLVCDIFAIYNVLKLPSPYYHDAFGVSIAMLVVFFIADIVTAVFVVRRMKVVATFYEKINCFGWHRYLCYSSEYERLVQNEQDLNKWWTRGKVFFHGAVIVTVTYFTQLVLFNFIFVLIGAVAAPVETGSLFMLYIASLFSLISFFAVILKVFHNVVLKENDRKKFQTQRPQPEKQVALLSKWRYCFYSVSLILLICTLAAGIGVAVSFIYIYTVLNQEYRNNRGIITFLGALLPSLLASTSGFFWTKVMPCIGKPAPATTSATQTEEPVPETEV